MTWQISPISFRHRKIQALLKNSILRAKYKIFTSNKTLERLSKITSGKRQTARNYKLFLPAFWASVQKYEDI